jgi:HEPN domain-containing protein
MSEDESAVLSKVAHWFRFADEDIRLARYASTMRETPYRLIAYHAQQCAEKYLKGYLVYLRVDFPYTHNVARLLELCREHGSSLDGLSDAEELTPYAITLRYPGEDEEVTADDAVRAMEVAELVRRTVRQRLSELGYHAD